MLPPPNPKGLVPNPLNKYPKNYPCPCKENDRGEAGKTFGQCCGQKPHAPIPASDVQNVENMMATFIGRFRPIVEAKKKELRQDAARRKRTRWRNKKAKVRKQKNSRRRNRGN